MVFFEEANKAFVCLPTEAIDALVEVAEAALLGDRSVVGNGSCPTKASLRLTTKPDFHVASLLEGSRLRVSENSLKVIYLRFTF